MIKEHIVYLSIFFYSNLEMIVTVLSLKYPRWKCWSISFDAISGVVVKHFSLFLSMTVSHLSIKGPSDVSKCYASFDVMRALLHETNTQICKFQSYSADRNKPVTAQTWLNSWMVTKAGSPNTSFRFLKPKHQQYPATPVIWCGCNKAMKLFHAEW